MDSQCYTLDVRKLDNLHEKWKKEALFNLEHGKVLYLPTYSFPLLSEDNDLLTDTLSDGKRKNISYNYGNRHLGGLKKGELNKQVSDFMLRYANFARHTVLSLCPQYDRNLQWGRTSYRPVEIKGRAASKRKDDTRLHVDAFPSTPVNGKRILRVFCNINPYNEPRVWNLGEPFHQVLARFAPEIPLYSPLKAKVMHWIKATRTVRTSYDHYMLHLHDRMKLDDPYQASVKKSRMDFPSYSTWLVFTDSVSHAALSGQYLLEQTFYLPPESMAYPEISPIKQLESFYKKKTLVSLT